MCIEGWTPLRHDRSSPGGLHAEIAQLLRVLSLLTITKG